MKTNPRNASQLKSVPSAQLCVWCDHNNVMVVLSILSANGGGLDVYGDSFEGNVA